MLKKISAPIILISFALALSSCNDPVDLSKFQLVYDSFVTFTEENTQEVDAIVFSNKVTFDLEEDMVFHGSQASALNTSFIKECALEVESPSTADFTFLKDAKLYIMSDSLPVKPFAEISDVPEAVKRFIIPIDSELDVADYLRNESFKIRIQFNTRRTLTEDVRVKLSTAFMLHTR